MTWHILFAEILTMKRVRQLKLQPTNTRSWIQLKHLHCDYYVPSSKTQWECRFAHVRRSVCRPNVWSITKAMFGLKLCKQVTHTRFGLKLWKQVTHNTCWFWGHCDLSCKEWQLGLTSTRARIDFEVNISKITVILTQQHKTYHKHVRSIYKTPWPTLLNLCV